MEERKRTIFAIVIACVVLIAMLYSFGMNLFSPRPQLVLADPNATASQSAAGEEPGSEGGIPVEVTPETVQLVIEHLERYTSYSRTVTVEYRWASGGIGSATARVWVNDGWARTDTTLASGMVEHSIVGNEQLWLWYDDEETVYHGSAGEMTADLMQRLPTYEDILALNSEDITRAGYVDRDGQPCIYVEARQKELDYRYRYWISVNSGLLMASETVHAGEVIYSMTSREVVSPLADAQSYFTLPDGTNLSSLHQDQAEA